MARRHSRSSTPSQCCRLAIPVSPSSEVRRFNSSWSAESSLRVRSRAIGASGSTVALRLDLGRQNNLAHRLEQVIVAAGSDASLDILCPAERTEEDDSAPSRRRFQLPDLALLRSRRCPHYDVEQDQIRRSSRKRSIPVAPVSAGIGVIPIRWMWPQSRFRLLPAILDDERFHTDLKRGRRFLNWLAGRRSTPDPY